MSFDDPRVIRIKGPADILQLLLMKFYRIHKDSLKIIGITGTNGKETAFSFMVRSLFHAAIPILVPFLFSCGAFDRSEESVVVRVGDREITKKEFVRDIQIEANRVGVSGPDIKGILKPLIKKMVDEYLILEFGEREGITVSDTELKVAVLEIKQDYQEDVFREMMLRNYVDYEEWKEDLRHRILIEKILRNASEKMPPVTSQEIKAYFEEHREDFRSPKRVRFRQLVVETEEEAEALSNRLKKGETLADLSRDRGAVAGEPCWFQKGELEETMEEVIFSLPVGRTSEIVETPYGYHIIEVLEIRPEGLRSLPEAMDEIESKLSEEKGLAFHVEWLDSLRKTIPVEVDEEAVNALDFGQATGERPYGHGNADSPGYRKLMTENRR
jgi:parvulin-like peptidyl-prolyl isomerase